ncbi:MAG: signal peptidase II [Bacilli bacterium]|nr:signal peptidase II [Bacilli bacterium]
MNRKTVIIGIIALVIDQITKSLMQIYDVHFNIINEFLRLNYIQNTGAAWSILEGKQYLLIGITILMLILVYNMSFSYDNNKLNNFTFGILFGGIIGNLFDRVLYGMVRDFIDINVFGYNFPVFNIADMLIVLGVVILLISTFKGELKKWKLK